jgi:hypothetical protein
MLYDLEEVTQKNNIRIDVIYKINIFIYMKFFLQSFFLDKTNRTIWN